MKQPLKRMLSILLCCLLVLAAGTGAYAYGSRSAQAPAADSGISTAATEGASKDETVYVLAGADGAVQKVIVSDWIRNPLGDDTIEDVSELSQLEPLKGESYTMGGNNTRVWDAQGNDVYYQGNLDKEVPVGLSVTYRLDGESITPAELAGKSGRVTLRFDYTNRQSETVLIDGEKAQIYVPFAMLTGLLLDNERFSNVEVSNGKVINDGDRTAVVGFAFPGLQENLALDRETLELPDYVELSADVTDFSLGMTVTIATNAPFRELDPAQLDSIDGLRDALDQLSGAMEQLMSGSSQLYEGLCTLLEKSEELAAGIDTLAAGAKTLRDGTGGLSSGATQLQQGAAELSTGLNTLTANSSSLNSGALQVFQTLLATANTQLSAAGLDVPAMTPGNYAEVLNGVIASLDETAVYQAALNQVTQAVEDNRQWIQEQVIAAVRENVAGQVSAAVEQEVRNQVTQTVEEAVATQVIQSATGMDKDTYEAAVAAGVIDAETQAAVTAAIEAQMVSEAVQSTISSQVAAQMASEAVQSKITEAVTAQMSGDTVQALIAETVQQQVEQAIAEQMASAAVQAQLQAASEGAKTVISLKASLDSYNAFYLGLNAYTSGVASAAEGAASLQAGADALKQGADQLYGGANTLYQGILTLRDGVPALADGITQLRDGAMQLSEGLTEFNEQGVEKLTEAVDGDLTRLLLRLRATVEVAQDYQSFSGIREGMDGEVRFVYRTEEIPLS